jgi:tetratricopeptide (TPR) repeat protein
MAKNQAWIACPTVGRFGFDPDRLTASWSRLHRGDAEPLPKDPDLMAGWVQFHNGEFEKACRTGLAIGGSGITLANKATCIHACYVEPREQARLDLLVAAAQAALAQQDNDPANANAWYWHAYALGRYSQSVSVAKALTQGLGKTIRASLLKAIELAPHHTDAHLALANYHAEVIDKVGVLIAGMTHGVKRDAGLAFYESAMALNPDSPITLAEFAQGLVMLQGKPGLPLATRLLERAASIEPLDAMESLYVASARMALDT